MKDLLRTLRAYLTLLWSLSAYAATGRTPGAGLQAMIHAHARSNGWSTALLAKLFRLGRPAQPIAGVRDPANLFAALGEDGAEAVVRGLREDGYAVAPIRIPAETVARLRRFAETTPGDPWDAKGTIGARQLYDRDDRRIAKFQFDGDDLANQPDLQDLAADAALLDVAQRYLGCLPVLDSIAMWWSTPHLAQAADEIAQRFHIDYDRVRWLKVFIYLTDVTPDNGPHVFVRHSHLREPRRAGLIGRGYVRIADEDVARAYRPEEFISICGPAGTVLFEDTSGFHKGSRPEQRERLMLEYQFSCNLFGANYKPMRMRPPLTPRLEQARRSLAGVYPLFV